DPVWAAQLGELGRQRVEIAMSWESIALRLGSLYNKLLAQSAPVPATTPSGSSVKVVKKSDVQKLRDSVA
ncbi:MAG TPA: hypothetical protein V6D50_26815, partial [Chroococcales cyanobacterium]